MVNLNSEKLSNTSLIEKMLGYAFLSFEYNTFNAITFEEFYAYINFVVDKMLRSGLDVNVEFTKENILEVLDKNKDTFKKDTIEGNDVIRLNLTVMPEDLLNSLIPITSAEEYSCLVDNEVEEKFLEMFSKKKKYKSPYSYLDAEREYRNHIAPKVSPASSKRECRHKFKVEVSRGYLILPRSLPVPKNYFCLNCGCIVTEDEKYAKMDNLLDINKLKPCFAELSEIKRDDYLFYTYQNLKNKENLREDEIFEIIQDKCLSGDDLTKQNDFSELKLKDDC